MKRLPPIHPVIFSLYPPVFLYAVNIHRFRFPVLFLPVIIILSALFVFWYAFKFVFRNNDKTALFLSVNIHIFFIYGHACEFLRDVHIQIGPVFLGHNKLLFGVWVPVFVIGMFYLLRLKRELSGFTTFLTIVSIVLILFPFSKILLFGFAHENIVIQNDNSEIDRMVSRYKEQNDSRVLPDIYYIIPDNYLRADILKEIYHYDNNDFINFLSQKGFYIIEKSHSNYLSTDQSLASSLNFEYLDNVISRMPKNSINRHPLIELRANAKIIRFLKGIGYSYIYLSDGFESIEHKYTTSFLSPGWTFGGHFLNEFQNGLINMTPVPYILRLFPNNSDNYFEQFRSRTRFAFGFLANAHEWKGPKFVVAHIITPNDPIVFDANGEELDGVWLRELRGKNHEEFIKRYLGELQYANKKIMYVIDRILTYSAEKPVIIIQADHGNSVIEASSEIPSREFLHQKFAILNALYLPDYTGSELYPEMTPLNCLRVVLNHCFNTNLPFLKDEIYYSKWETPYNVYNVTDSILGAQ